MATALARRQEDLLDQLRLRRQFATLLQSSLGCLQAARLNPDHPCPIGRIRPSSIKSLVRSRNGELIRLWSGYSLFRLVPVYSFEFNRPNAYWPTQWMQYEVRSISEKTSLLQQLLCKRIPVGSSPGPPRRLRTCSRSTTGRSHRSIGRAARLRTRFPGPSWSGKRRRNRSLRTFVRRAIIAFIAHLLAAVIAPKIPPP